MIPRRICDLNYVSTYMVLQAATRATIVTMLAGIKQPRPTTTRSLVELEAVPPAASAQISPLPKLVVFDLDNTLWT